MKDRMLVGSSYKNGWFIAPLVLAGLLMGAELLWGRMWGSRGVLTVLGFGLMLFASVVWGLIYLRRRWIDIGAEGFEIDGPGFHQTWRDLEVASLAWSTKRNYANGVPKSETCFLAVADAKGRRAKMAHERGLEGTNAFVDFASRLFEGLSGRTREHLEKGGELKGEGWKLGREALTFTAGEIRISEVSAVAEFDGQLRVWRKGSNDAAFGIGAGTVNATLLRHFLDELRPKEEGAAIDSGDDLGRVLFERRGPRGVLLYLLGVVALLFGVPIMTQALGGGLVVIGVGLLLFAWGWWVGGLMFRCHHGGVSRRTRSGTRTIRYRDTAVFTYRATRHFVNGAYTGTTMAMEFVSRPELGREKITWSASLQGMDEEIDKLRDHISTVMAMRWMEDLCAGKPVDWTSNLRLHPDGLEFRPSGFIGHKDWVKKSFGEVAGTSLEKGFFYLFIKGEPKSSIGEPVSVPNFFPGYYVLLRTLQPPS